MGKSCCAVGCSARYKKGTGVKFYRFPKDPERKRQWVAAIKRKNWEPNEHSWLCSNHFVGGVKSNEANSPAFNPTIFAHTTSLSGKSEEKLRRFARLKQASRRRRLQFVTELAHSNAEDHEDASLVSEDELHDCDYVQ